MGFLVHLRPLLHNVLKRVKLRHKSVPGLGTVPERALGTIGVDGAGGVGGDDEADLAADGSLDVQGAPFATPTARRRLYEAIGEPVHRYGRVKLGAAQTAQAPFTQAFVQEPPR